MDKIGNNSFLNACRALHPWQTLSLDKFIGVGTNAKYYTLESGQAYYDITPLRLTITLSNNPFACSNNSNEITVTHTNHNAISGDFVSFSGAATLGSTNITDVIKSEYRINEIVDSNTYKIIARNVS